jgi:hypothetical protein
MTVPPPPSSPSRTRSEFLVALTVGSLAFWLPFLLYLRTLCPTFFPGDSAELSAAAWCLGVPHPTGYPLYMVLGWGYNISVRIAHFRHQSSDGVFWRTGCRRRLSPSDRPLAHSGYHHSRRPSPPLSAGGVVGGSGLRRFNHVVGSVHPHGRPLAHPCFSDLDLDIGPPYRAPSQSAKIPRSCLPERNRVSQPPDFPHLPAPLRICAGGILALAHTSAHARHVAIGSPDGKFRPEYSWPRTDNHAVPLSDPPDPHPK